MLCLVDPSVQRNSTAWHREGVKPCWAGLIGRNVMPFEDGRHSWTLIIQIKSVEIFTCEPAGITQTHIWITTELCFAHQLFAVSAASLNYFNRISLALAKLPRYCLRAIYYRCNMYVFYPAADRIEDLGVSVVIYPQDIAIIWCAFLAFRRYDEVIVWRTGTLDK